MTVSAEAAPGVDRSAVDQQFAEIYAEHYERLRKNIYFQNDLELAPLAEDFTQEAFIDLYRYLLKGGEAERPFGLLCCMGRHAVSKYIRLKKYSASRATDFTDPVNTPIVATGHAYAPETPELATVADELDAAMVAMTDASEKWRSLHHEKYRIRQLLRSAEQAGRLARIESRRRQLAAVEALEPLALVRFRETCHQVGVLRGELEQAGGANYRSAAGLPASAANCGAGRVNSVGSDLSITHCPEGHLLDLDNVFFNESGTRRCRACQVVRNERLAEEARDASKARADRRRVAAEVIDRARELLADPVEKRSVMVVAELLGVDPGTIYRAFPGGGIAVRRAAELVGAGAS